MPIADNYADIAKAISPAGNDRDYWAQIAEPMTEDEIKSWVIDAVEVAKMQGCTATRLAWCDDVEPIIILLEGWKAQPATWPEPKFDPTPIREGRCR